MKELRIAVLDSDPNYLDRLTKYLAVNKVNWLTSLSTYSSQEHLSSALHNDTLPHMLLISEDEVEYWQEKLKGKVMIVALIEQNSIVAMDKAPLQVNKLQPLERFFVHLQQLSRVNQAITSCPSAASGMSIIGVYSAVGRSGKSAIASNLAVGLAQQGYRPLYVSLESAVTPDLFPSVDAGQTYRQLLYYFRTNELQAQSKITAAIYTDARTRVDYFDQSLSDLDGFSETFSVHELKLALSWLQSTERYTHIILDMDSNGSSENWDKLGLCDKLIWVLLDDRIHLCKSAMIHRQWKEYASLMDYSVHPLFMLNQYTGMKHDNTGKLGFQLSMQLPYVSKWKAMSAGQQWLQEKWFREQLMSGYWGKEKGGT